jgi:hypothetical protein
MTPPAAKPEPSPFDVLKSEVEGYIDYSRTWMRVWAVSYYFLRTALIVLSALVAAKADLFGKDDTHTITVLSLLVAVGTSLDTWLKTGNRYKGHYTFNDKFISLYTDLALCDGRDSAVLDKLKEEFKKLIDDYAVAVLPT